MKLETLETGKYEKFRDVFCQLSTESQDKLVKIADQLLKIHRFTKQETTKNKKCLVSACCLKN